MPLFTGPNWDFGALRRVLRRDRAIAVDELGLDIYPVQIEVITSEQMLDAYASVGLPLMYRHWSFGKRFAYHETLYRKGLAGPRLRDRHQFQPGDLLHHGRELHDDADAGHGACRVRPQSFLQEQLPVPAVDRCRRHPRLSQPLPATTSPNARRSTGIEAVERVLDAAHALKEHGRQPLRPPLAAEPRRGAPPDRGAPRP